MSDRYLVKSLMYAGWCVPWPSTESSRMAPNWPTNQKVAGSSPAERATKYLQMQRFCLMKCSRRSVRTTHLTTYLFRNRLAGPVRSGRSALNPDAQNVAWVGILRRFRWAHDRSYESNKSNEAALLPSLRDLLTASNRLAGELGGLTFSPFLCHSRPRPCGAASPVRFGPRTYTKPDYGFRLDGVL